MVITLEILQVNMVNYTPDYNVWLYTNTDCNVGTIVSTSEGSPITNITYAQAISACEDIGAHLITNDEWMTLARNIEIVSSNWSEGVVGYGYLPLGNDFGGAKDGFDELSHSKKRTLTLTNGEVVWDLAGNVYDTIDINIDASVAGALPHYDDGLGNKYPTGYNFMEYGAGISGYEEKYIANRGLFDYKDLFMLNSSYNTNQKIGRIYTRADAAGVVGAARGGMWANGINAGILLLAFGTQDNKTYYTGFRCAVEAT